MGCAGTCLLG
ncbi:hypothetical protein CIB84_013114 [Bambusicola thoracicus]|uniref:Uncharacterized protein n=1 Tax=Bambusicola thoracicus TaxID=9083 RepID=A0A2P4SG92_BAMTH|nr:hypothetical protein CIB84_013114 [Bambusicola thoracicus]